MVPDPRAFLDSRVAGHGSRLGIAYHDHGADWAALALPYRAEFAGDAASGVLASGPVVTLMDMAVAIAIWLRRGRFAPQATLDLRVDYLRAATPGLTVIGRGECYKVTRSIAFVRGQAHDGNPGDPIAHVAGTFMLMEGF